MRVPRAVNTARRPSGGFATTPQLRPAAAHAISDGLEFIALGARMGAQNSDAPDPFGEFTTGAMLRGATLHGAQAFRAVETSRRDRTVASTLGRPNQVGQSRFDQWNYYCDLYNAPNAPHRPIYTAFASYNAYLYICSAAASAVLFPNGWPCW